VVLKRVVSAHENTPSTDDLSAGFGKKYVFTSASKAGEAIDFHIPYSELWLDVSELGLKIVDRDEVRFFPISVWVYLFL